MEELQQAPTSAPHSIKNGIVTAASGWFGDPLRPRLPEEIVVRWDTLLDEWVAAEDLPLIVRRPRNNRGHLLRHISGRSIIPSDNSPAHWSIALAFGGCCPSLDQVRETLSTDALPVAMAFKAEERLGARFRCTRRAVRGPNDLGWKVAHIENVGIGYAGDILSLPLAQIGGHMKRFLAPRNMFLVPKDYAGVAETPEFLAAFATRARPA